MTTKALARKLFLKHSQQIAPTMPSAPGPDDTSVHIPKSPLVPREFRQQDVLEEPSGIESIQDEKFKDPQATPQLSFDVMPSFVNPQRPTLGPDDMTEMPDWRRHLVDALDSMYYAHVCTGVYRDLNMAKIREWSEHSLRDLKAEMAKTVHEAQINALDYAHKMQRISFLLTKK